MKLWYEKGAWATRKARETAASMSPESVRSIVVIRHAAIGDMMVMRPFLIQAREFFPNAKITLSIVNNYAYGAPEDLVDRIHVVHKKKEGKKTTYAERLRDIKALGEHDIVFDMADTSLSGIICMMTKARLKIGFPYRRFKNNLFYDIAILRSDLVPEVETLLHMLYILGAPKKQALEYGYPPYETKQERPYIVYFTTASLGWKCWPQERFAELIARSVENYPDFEHVVLEGIRDYEKVDALMESLSAYPSVRKLDPMPLEELMPFLGKARMVVSGDTGIRNMAIAAGTPTVGIFFFTVPYRYLPIDERHHAVFNAEGREPHSEEVLRSMARCLA
ncbi:MAG: glycosyltransferase family 9 protein [Campylobacterota bacterium]